MRFSKNKKMRPHKENNFKNKQKAISKFNTRFHKNKEINHGIANHVNKNNLPSWAVTKPNKKPKHKKIKNQQNHIKTNPINIKTGPINTNPNEVYTDPNADVRELLKTLKIKPRNLDLYVEALTHSSYSNENFIKANYQRLEFLGDAILNKLVACFLYNMSDDDEGKMTKDRISIIQAKTLVRASIELNLGKYLRLGHGLVKRPISEKILEDIFEAFIGALFLDQDETRVNAVLMKTLFKYYLNDDLKNTIDYKTKFQEAVQEHGKHKNIVYRKINTNKHPNDYFEVELVYNGMVYGTGRASKLHEAEIIAAKKAWEKLSNYNKSDK